MAVTLRQVAEAAGVSVKTVSNVVNEWPHVTPKLRAHVQSVLEELNYRPNTVARNLRNGRTGLIALAVPSLHNPYFAELAQLIVEAAHLRGLTVLVECTNGDRARERTVVDGFARHMVDGLLLCPHALGPADLRDRRDRTPLVLLGERIVRSADSVAVDSRAAARAATAHLLGLGRRRVGVIGFAPERGRSVARLRVEGYRAALEAAGIKYDPGLVVRLPPGQRSEQAGAAAEELLARRPEIDALFAFSDEFGLATLRALVSAGVPVPDRVAVIGIDDIVAGRLTSPSLSTVAPDKPAIVDAAIGMLADRLNGNESPPRHVAVGFTIVSRESTPPASPAPSASVA